jgi:hypothetical protein
MSGKSIAEKLQVKGQRTIAVVGASAPLDALIGAKKARADIAVADVVLLVIPDRNRFDTQIPRLLKKKRQEVIFWVAYPNWVAYPKLTSKLASDLSRDIIAASAPNIKLNTVSQIAIDDDWSALRLKRL